jgi:glycogen synthase
MATKGGKILLVGPYPPPYGGLSVQIHELNRYLKREGYSSIVLNIGESRKETSEACLSAKTAWQYLVLSFMFARRGFILHLFTNGHNVKSWLSAVVCSLSGLFNGRKTILTFGSGNLRSFLSDCNILCRLLVRVTLHLAGAVVCRNDEMRHVLERNGAGAAKVIVMAGFAGLPVLGDISIPFGFQFFKSAHSPLIGAIGSIEPEYGISLLLQAFVRLKQQHPGMGLVLIGLDAANLKRIGDYDDLVPKLYLPGELPHDTALAVIKNLDVFVRPTYFDGDANSVREALALGVPVVASATTYRPPGVKTFPTGDPLECAEKIEGALKEGRVQTRKLVATSSKLQALEKLYITMDEGLSMCTIASEKDQC